MWCLCDVCVVYMYAYMWTCGCVNTKGRSYVVCVCVCVLYMEFLQATPPPMGMPYEEETCPQTLIQ